MIAPPTPHRSRWQPLRAGLVDLFYYDAEEFHFHDGRLLLRGNNGTGKSKVLALTLPFLLDGDLSPHRVEPDGDRNKRMEWNLLLGGKHPHTERLGYTWLEFGRALPDGGAEYRTIGCGLKAVSGRGIARHWFFVTSQRVGPELSLLSPTRVALTREKLKEAVERHGMVYDTASDYRRAVDESLFGLGVHRYEALVNLLIQLRQPQLSKKPDERLLSRALTEALPPLDPALISTVAEAFRGLDEERETVRGLAEAKSAAEAFLTHYRRYARVAAKRWATPPRQLHSRYEHLGRELGDAEAAYEQATAAVAATRTLLDALGVEKSQLETRREVLQSSPEMRNAEAIKREAAAAVQLEEVAAGREREHTAAEDTVRRRQAELASTRTRVDADAASFTEAKEVASSAASAALLTEDHAVLLPTRPDGDLPDDVDLGRAERAGAALIQRQTTAIARLQDLLDAAGKAEAILRTARDDVDRITGEQQSAIDRIASAEEETEERGATLVAEYHRYLAGPLPFPLTGGDDLLAALAAWAETLDGANPAAAAVDEVVRGATAELGRRQAAVDQEQSTLLVDRARVVAEIARLESGGHDVPPAPHTRDERAREGQPGAPLWRAVDFVAGLADDQRTGIESALEAAGILDAWISPDGELRDVVSGDVIVVPGEDAPAGGLTAVLTPAVDRVDPLAAALSDDAVRSVLRAIGLGPGSGTWVAADGRFVVGVLAGTWRKESAAYIGEGAREAARRVRLDRLRVDLAELDGRLVVLADTADRLAADSDALAAKHRALPPDDDLRAAHVKLAGAHEAKRFVDTRLAEAIGLLEAQRARADQARGEATEFAGDVRLPATADGLAAVRGALGNYRVALAGLWPAARSLHRAREELGKVADELSSAAERRELTFSVATRARADALVAAERHRVLVDTAGAGVQELYRKLAAVAAELAARDIREREARDEETDAREKRGKADGRRETLRESIAAAAIERDQAIAELRAFAATGLLTTALPALEFPDPETTWAPNPAVALARTINAVLEDVDDAERAWENVQQRVTVEHKTLTDALSQHGHSVGMALRDGVVVVDVVFQGRAQDVPTLAEALAAETAQRAALLSAKEREILENHLINEVAGTLQELITNAEDQVRAINADLEARPTSTGMRLRLLWRTARAAPDGLDRVRDRLLRQTADAWSVDDRTTVGAFLQEQINREHSADAAGGWVDQLTRALDYRSWHEFAIQRHQDGQWRPAAGPASGGERVLAASLPLFAAASSFYSSSGNPHAPRLIALDEAFAGVDDDSRAKCLGLLAAFDLDVVMTSEREWGCYPQVPGLAIAQLARREGIDAVLVMPWRWDGHDRVRVERPVPYVPVA